MLSVAPPKVSKIAADILSNMNIKFKLQSTVIDEHQLPNGGLELKLSTGETLTADVYIPTFGLIPNSSFIPARFLNAKGFATVDANLNLKGRTDVWALGDVCDMEYCQILSCNRQTAHVAQSVIATMSGKTVPPYKPATKLMMGVQFGKKAGTGFYGSWKIPSFIPVMLRKTLFVEKLGPTVEGTA